MKATETILEIIDRHSAEEIVEIIKTFIEWTHTNDSVHFSTNPQGLNAPTIKEWWINNIRGQEKDSNKKSFNDIFEFWCKNK